MYALGNYYENGHIGVQQDHPKAVELWNRASELGSSNAHCLLGTHYYKGGDLKKALFHYEAGAMAGHDVARYNSGTMEFKLGIRTL